MTAEFDAGEIHGQERFEVDPRETATTLHARTVAAARRLLRRALPAILGGGSRGRPMDPSLATATTPLAPLRERGRTDTVESLDRAVRAFARPYPGVRFRVPGGGVILWEGGTGPRVDGIPIPVADGMYRAVRLGIEGGPELGATEFRAAHPEAAADLERPDTMTGGRAP